MFAMTADRELAAEVTDEAFARALQHWDRVSVMAEPDAWVYRVAVNVARRMGRRRALERSLLIRAVSHRVAEPRDDVDMSEMLAPLTERQRLAVVLRYVADLPERTIAEVMGVARGTVASTLADARRVLREVLRDDVVAEERS